MANITGKDGVVHIAGTALVGIKEFSADYAVDMFDVTAMADAAVTHKESLPGLKQMTGTLSGNMTDGATGVHGVITIGTEYAVILKTDGTDNYAFSAFFSNISTSVAVGGEATVSASFTSTGVVTPSFS